jgi:SRSO17 transposase
LELPERPAWGGTTRKPALRYREPPAALRDLALAAGTEATRTVAWREGSKGTMRSRFLALRVRPANVGLRRAHREALPLAWLLCQWPEGEAEPTKYWLVNLPAAATLVELVRLGKLRWRIEQDYRELKDALGLDHFQGRSLRGWNHHVRLVSLAHGFLTLQRVNPQADAPA